MIALRSVSLRSRATGAAVFSSFSFDLGPGQVALATGPSGSGKTALARLLHATARPDEGEVCVFGHDLARLRASSLPQLRRRVAVVPQELALIERDTVLANAAAGLVVAACPKRQAQQRAAEALQAFGILDLARVPVARLSSGQRRRVALARAAATEPVVLVADDPTAHLDGDGRMALLAFVALVAERGGAALVASSDPALAAAAMRLDWKVIHLGCAEAAAEPSEADELDPAGNVVPFPGARIGSTSSGGPS